jgi:hypothetical protein
MAEPSNGWDEKMDIKKCLFNSISELSKIVTSNPPEPENKNGVSTPESRRNTGQEMYGSDILEGTELQGDEAIREGIAVEAEHKDMISWLKETMVRTGSFPADQEIFAKIAEAHLTELKETMVRTGSFPADQEIFAKIAEAHLTEDPEYYKKLAQVEKKNSSDERNTL